VGGSGCIAESQIMGIGTASHELGHGLGLPDLYDISGQTQGVGEWGLMGSANYRSLLSPGHFDAWCKEAMGWVAVRELTAAGSYQLGPVVTGDTVFLIRPRASNPRGEYFLLENKQPFGSDSDNLLVGGSLTGPKVGGLLVWHIDSLKIVSRGLSMGNSVNAGYPHGVSLIQADALSQLDITSQAGGNRGDAGDPYPGRTANRALLSGTNPGARMNATDWVSGTGPSAGFGLTDIQQLGSNGPVSLTLAFETIVRASDTLARVRVGGQSFHRYQAIVPQDTGVTVSVDSAQTSDDARARFAFVSWSDGGARTHGITLASVGDSLVAALDASYQLLVNTSGAGNVAASPAADLGAGTFFPAGSSVRLVVSTGPDSVFEGWTGDTATRRDTLVLSMRRPYSLSASFAPRLQVAAIAPSAGVMGAPYSLPLPAQGGTGKYFWTLLGGKVPPGLFVDGTGSVAGTPEGTGTFDLTLQVT
jgi:hypothetical protein